MWDQPTGTGRYAASLVAAIARLDSCNEYVLLTTRTRHGTAAKAYGHNFYRRPIPCDDRLLKGLWLTIGRPTIETLMGDVDVFHATNIDFVPSKRAKRVVTIHDVSFLSHPWYFPAKDRWLHRRALLRSLREADRIIAVSEETAKQLQLRLGILSGRITVVPEAPADPFTPAPDLYDRQLRACHGIANPYFLFAGTLEPRKGVPRLLDAFLGARRGRSVGQDLVLVGRMGWLAHADKEALRVAEASGFVKYLGYVTDAVLAGLMRGADAFVYPSSIEGFGLPVVEAMACGAPVITSSTGALGELADGAAITVDPSDNAGLRDALVAIGNDADLRSRLRGLGSVRASSYSWDRTAKETLAVYVS